MIKRFAKGIGVILFAIISAVLLSIVKDHVVILLGHEARYNIIFGLFGGIMALCSIGLASVVFTNNFGKGFNNKQ